MDRIPLTLTKNQMLTCGSGKRIDKNTFLDANCGGKSCRAHFFKKFFSEDEMLRLKDRLLQCPKQYWERKTDKRGTRRFLYSGHWKHRFYNLAFGAGKAGKLELENPFLKNILVELGKKVSREALSLKRPDVYLPIREAGFEEQDFGMFHLFMCPAGRSFMHTDDNDFVSCIFSISLGSGDGDGLHMGGCGVDFNLRVGDLVIADTDIFFHGSPSYQGNEHPKIISENDRLVGLFILHRKFMIMKGVPADDLEREPYEFRTIPNQNQKKKKEVDI